MVKPHFIMTQGPMFVLATWIILVGLGIYRALVLALPFFHEAVVLAPALNVACGLLSDLSFGLLLTVVWLTLARVTPERGRKTAGIVFLVIACLYVYSLAAHVRYVEHFGMNARPYHTAAMENSEMWTVGTMMVLTSFRAWVILIILPTFLILGRTMARHAEDRWRALSWKKAGARLGLVAAVALAAHAGVIQLRNKPGMHAELRYSVYAALYYNYQDYKSIKAVPMPTPEQLAKLRDLLHGPRAFADGEIGRQYPLWQTQISTRVAPHQEEQDLRQALKDFIEETAAKEGPWNVVVVLSESLRAHEINAMGEAPADFAALTPGFDEIAAQGIRFTEVISSGLRTHFGQTSAQCSLQGALDFTILQGAPMSDSVCLGDVFSLKGYDTYFFYGADNHFDNQDVFYLKHKIRHVEDENDMPKGLPKGGWGNSDASLFAHAAKRLGEAKQPFFATVLTLTNHAPLKLPEDAPKERLKPGGSDREHMVQYVDWSVGNFYTEMRQRFPRTLLVVIADHGQFWGNEGFYNQIPTYPQLRMVARIPLFIVPLHPNVPQSIKGKRVPTLTSNIDVPPTILSLLGWTGVKQQFMGADAFSREGPVYIDWFNKLLALESHGGAEPTVTRIDAEREELLGTAGRYNLLAPPPRDWGH